MWEKWEHAENKTIKSEKYKESAFIDLYYEEGHYEIICSVTDIIMFHTITVNGTESEALKSYKNVKLDLENIIDVSIHDKEKEYDLCMNFIDKW